MAAPMPGPRHARGTTPLRGAAGWLLLLAVVLAHWQMAEFLADDLADDRLGQGAASRLPPRIDVAFVRSLQAAAPPAAAPAVSAAPAARLPAVSARPPRAAASAAAERDGAGGGAGGGAGNSLRADRLTDPALATLDHDARGGSSSAATETATLEPSAASSALTAAASGVAATPVPAGAAVPPGDAPAVPGAAAIPAPIASAAASLGSAPPLPHDGAATVHDLAAAEPVGAAAASAVAGFAWPPSTRLSYRLSGNYRGPVEGKAQVEWLREGSRYQVRMATSIGPVLSRSIVSAGELTDEGLRPQRFTGEQKVIFRDARRWAISFDDQRVVNVDGRTLPTQPGVQDEASQFVQLTWLFTTQPSTLRIGQTLTMPLLISRQIDRWVYEVVDEETLYFPFGQVATFHVKPQREASGGDMTAEIWVAPTLQYLPVRILIRQGKEGWADLTLLQAPEQAAR